MSEKWTDAFDFSIVNIILTIIYPKIKIPGKMKEVKRETFIQLFPPQNL